MIKHNGPGKNSRSDNHPREPKGFLTHLPQMLMQQQDHTLTSISGTLATLTEQAGLMGHEIGEHNESTVAILDTQSSYLLAVSTGCLTIYKATWIERKRSWAVP